MKMRNLLFGVILGLLAVVRSTPVDNLPAKTDDDILREALTDGFLLDGISSHSLTTASPKSNTTVHASRQPPSEPRESEIEGSGVGETLVIGESTTSAYPRHGGENFTTTAVSVSQSSTSKVLPGDTDTSGSHSSTTQRPQSSFTSSAVPKEGRPNVTPDHVSVSLTTDPAVSTSPSSDWSGGEEMLGQYLTTTSGVTSSFNTQTTAASSSTSKAIFISESDFSGSGSGMEDVTLFNAESANKKHKDEASTSETSTTSMETNKQSRSRLFHPELAVETKQTILGGESPNAEPQSKGHSTPGWIIIVGFIVGVAALVMLCLAIATRDKWNGPSQPSQLETKTNSANQQRELEMETFLHKESPRENGKAAEYTVIPLDELDERYSSH